MMVVVRHSPLVVALILMLASSSLLTVQAVKCGEWYSNACIGDEDVRYDPDYTNNILEQDPRWGSYTGFWEVEISGSDGNGGQYGPAIFDPTAPGRPGLPYNRTRYRAFYNHTITGSRMETNRYYLIPPPDPSFCQIPIQPPQMNVLGAGTCGVNGIAVTAGYYSTSSFEKDGTIRTFRSFGIYVGDGNNTIVDDTFRVVDDNTRYGFAGGGNGFSFSVVLVYLNQEQTVASSTQNFYITGDNARLLTMLQMRLTKLANESEFIQRIQATYNEYNILTPDQVQGGVLPTQTVSLEPDAYPTEAEWCRFDPNCATSPYQEPDGSVRAGVVAGFVVAFFVLMIVALVGIHVLLMKRQEQRNRKAFVSRIASTVNLRASTNALSPEGLVKEFQAIDGELGKGDGDGYISKEELWEFMSSGKAGEMDKNDFNALFSAIDTDDSGKVDFLEFCAFLGECTNELEDAANARSAAASAVARKLSMRANPE